MAPRIEFPDRGMGEHVDWTLLRTDMAIGMGQLAEAVYSGSKLPLREREAARWTIALINHCAVCQGTRAKEGPAADIDEDFYAAVTDWRTTDALSAREKLAAEYAQRFALDHVAMDDEFWARLRGAFADDEVVDLTISCGMWLGMGRAMAVVGVAAPEERLLV